MIEQNLKELEEKSIYILREANARFKNIAVLWSMGKDSTTMLYLIRKAFLGKVPFPVIHIDNGIDFPESYKFRDELVKKWHLNLIVAKSEIKPEISGFSCCGANKTEALKKVLKEHKFDALIVSIRRDEHAVRGKERYFCFPKGSLIYGADIKPIEKIKVGDYVYTHTGDLKQVEKLYKRNVDEELISITPRYGLPILVTKNHEILAKSNIINTGRPRIALMHASELKVGDKVFIPKLKFENRQGIEYTEIDKLLGTHKGININKESIWWNSAHSNSLKGKRIISLTPDVMLLFGFYIAEGSNSYSGRQINFAFNKDELNIADHIVKTLKNEFNVNSKIRKVTKNGISVDANSKTLSLLFPMLFGKGAHNKHLPYFFNELNEEQLLNLIKGCWLGDGHAERYSTVSKILAHQIRLSLLKLGILSSIKKTNDGRYTITIAGLSKSVFKNKFNIKSDVPYIGKYNVRETNELHPHYNINLKRSRNGGFWIPIDKIEKIHYHGPVYDLTVKENSSYLVEGITVHNSPRDKNFKWNYKNQPAELWDDYSSKIENEGHVRIHPLLDWNEIDVWRYIKQEHIPVNPLYFSRNGFRYRSLGCTHCTVPIKSNSKTIDDIIKELKTTNIEERAGREQDKEKEFIMQRLRALGYL